MADRDPESSVSIDLQSWSDFCKDSKLKAGDKLVYMTRPRHKQCFGLVQTIQYGQQQKIKTILIQIEQGDKQLVDSILSFCQEGCKTVSESPANNGLFAQLFVLPAGELLQKPKRPPGTVCRIRIVGPQEIKLKDLAEWSNKRHFINATSKSAKPWSRGLSPFFLGPVDLPSGDKAKVMENAWQFTKVFKQFTDSNNDPTEEYWKWAREGWNNPEPIRFPMGRGAKPEYCSWKGQQLKYIDSRKQIYCPSYAACVEKTAAFAKLKEIYESENEIIFWDFDGYSTDDSLKTILNNPNRIMGHAFVLAMLLTNQRHWLEQ